MSRWTALDASEPVDQITQSQLQIVCIEWPRMLAGGSLGYPASKIARLQLHTPQLGASVRPDLRACEY